MSADRNEIPDLAAVADAYERATGFEQPPAVIDHAIRRAAAEHARRGARRARLRRVSIGFAAAATIALTLATLSWMERGSLPPEDDPRAVRADDSARALDAEDGDAAAKFTFDAAEPVERANECAPVASAPEPWLGCIATLARAGRADDAARELDAFRAQYPDYAVPADLDPTAPR